MSDEEHADDDLVILCRFPFEMEAAPVVTELEANDISASLVGGFTAGFIAEAPGDVQVKVLFKDFEKAREILKRFQDENDHIDWSKVDVGEPSGD